MPSRAQQGLGGKKALMLAIETLHKSDESAGSGKPTQKTH